MQRHKQISCFWPRVRWRLGVVRGRVGRWIRVRRVVIYYIGWVLSGSRFWRRVPLKVNGVWGITPNAERRRCTGIFVMSLPSMVIVPD